MNSLYKEKIETEMKIRGLSKETIECYSSCLSLFMRNFKGRKPKDITLGDIKRYSQALSNRGQSNRYINMQLSAIRFFYSHVCKPCFEIGEIPSLKEHKKLPMVFSQEEIKSILSALKNIKHRAMLTLLYSTGMRINELVNLRVEDVDSKAMLIFIRHGKGSQQRYVPLSAKALEILREYWRAVKPKSKWLFSGLESYRISRSDYVSTVFRLAKKSLA